MTAEIVSFPSPRIASAIIEGLPLAGRMMPVPANVLALAAAAEDAPSKGVAVAALKLIAACRELADSLTVLSAHCRSADGVMAEIGDGATTIATAEANRFGPEPMPERPRE